MKKIIMILAALMMFNAQAFLFESGNFFSNQTITGTVTVYSPTVASRETFSLDWKGQGTAVKGVYTLQASNDVVADAVNVSRWYDVSKDVYGATITMAITSTGTTTSGLVNIGPSNYRWYRLKYVPDSATASAILNSSYLTKGW